MKTAKTSCRAIHVNSKRDKGVASYFKAPTRTDEAPFAVCMNHTTPVKMTRPGTHEELRLNKRAAGGESSNDRSYSGMLSQSQSV